MHRTVNTLSVSDLPTSTCHPGSQIQAKQSHQVHRMVLASATRRAIAPPLLRKRQAQAGSLLGLNASSLRFDLQMQAHHLAVVLEPVPVRVPARVPALAPGLVPGLVPDPASQQPHAQCSKSACVCACRMAALALSATLAPWWGCPTDGGLGCSLTRRLARTMEL